MSKEKPMEFKQECIGFVESDIFPTMCAHFKLNGECSFFFFQDLPIDCDDLQEKSDE